jgi:hypothetical protein
MSGGAQVAAPAARTRGTPKRSFRPCEAGSARRDTWPLSDIPFNELDILVTAHGLQPDAMIAMKIPLGNCTFA